MVGQPELYIGKKLQYHVRENNLLHINRHSNMIVILPSSSLTTTMTDYLFAKFPVAIGMILAMCENVVIDLSKCICSNSTASTV